MRRGFATVILALGLAGACALGAETGHYVNGVEGLRCGSIPPPGVYLRSYNAYYTADEITDADGDDMDIDFEIDVMASVNRLIWITDKKILGGDYGMDIFFPIQSTDLEIGALGVDNRETGVGDVILEPILLSWHGERWDLGAAFAVYVPTGAWEAGEPAQPGRDFWTGMFTFGGTYYLDCAKTWSASLLARYEIHSEKDESDITPGNDFHFEWGIGKKVTPLLEVGVTGYCQWQVTDDEGSDVVWDAGVHDRVFAVGPEINYSIPKWKTNVSLRHNVEFGARDRSEGSITTLTITKAF